MKSVSDTEFLVIDFETITPKGRAPEPIEIGMLRIKKNEIDYSAAVSCLIQPPDGLHVTEFDTNQTGIKDSDLIGKPTAIQILKKLDNSCSRKDYVFIAQNAKYEDNILSHYTDECTGISKTPIIDTILLAKHVLPGLPNYKLDTLAKALKLPIPKNRHRALADCLLTAKVFLKLIELQKEKKVIESIDDLLDIAEIQTKYNTPKQLELFDL